MNALNYKLIAIDILNQSLQELNAVYEEDVPELLGIDKKDFEFLRENPDKIPNLDYEFLVAALLCLIDDED